MPHPVHVVLVESEPEDAGRVLRELRRAGFEPEASIVATEADYRAALECEPDVVLSEFHLQNLDGLRALKILRERDPDLPFIIVAGALDDEDTADCLRSEVTDYVLKDRMDRLGLAVANALALRRARNEHRRSREALERSERYRRFIFENSQDLLLVLCPEGKPLFYSPSVPTTFGRRPDELEGRSVFDFVHPDDRDAALAVFVELLEHYGSSRAVQLRMSHRDGSWRTIEALGKNLMDEPMVGGIVVTARDVTHRVEADAERVLQSAALNAAANAIVITDTEGEISWVNPAFTQLTGYSMEESIGRTPRFLQSGAQSPTFYEDLWRTIRAGEIWRGELINRRKDGTLYTEEQTITPVRQNGVVSHFIAIKQNVTERKEAEQRLQAALERATESDHLKSAFLANMSHEVRTPLNVIIGYTSLMAERCRTFGDTELDELVAHVERASQRLMKTIQSVLDTAKLETENFELHPTSIDPGRLVERVVAAFRSTATEKGLELACDVEAGGTVFFDEYCLERALQNLLENAIKFTVEGSVTVSLVPDGDETLLLTVEDTGIGIDASYLSEVFRPFTQEENGYARNFEGSGLGLSLTKRYLESGGATIEVRSEKGRGTHVRVRLPRALDTSGTEADEGVVPTVASGAKTGEGERPLVLIVEDDTDTQRYMQMALTHRVRLAVAASAEEAREVLRTNRDVAAILLDLSLRGSEDGLALTRELRTQEPWRTLPIIALTAHVLAEDKRRCLVAGCNAYLAKPVQPQRIVELLERVFAGEPAASGSPTISTAHG